MSRPQAITAIAITSLTFGAPVIAESDVDRAFTATGASCDQITWSREALAKYPQLASACQDVMERDGKYYVKFSGTVRRVADRGRSVTVNFKDGGELALTPPENMSLYINGRPKAASRLQRGDELTFYVPQDKLAAPPPEPTLTIIPITRIRVAQAPAREPAAAELPKTASALPSLGLCGVLLMSLGAVLTTRRRPA